MACDYMFFRLKKPITGPEDLGDDTTLPIGSAQRIVARLSEALPDLAWSPFGGCVRASGVDEAGPYEIIFGCGGSELTFTLETPDRPGADGPPPVVGRICEALGLVALDGERGALVGSLEPPAPRSPA